MRILSVVVFFLLNFFGYSQKNKSYNIVTVGFYNVENLFDTENDPITFDDDRTPEGKDRWTADIYAKKVRNMAYVISQIGADVTGSAPALLGLAEVENRQTVEDLANDPQLLPYRYGIVHFDSPDRRGIDVALLYKQDVFKLIGSNKHELILYNADEPLKRVYTRDQLVVNGMLHGDQIYVIVNHWPSRSGGEARSSWKREAAAALNRSIIDSIQSITADAKIITMGDLNDDPTNKSVREVLGSLGERKAVRAMGLYNPMESIFQKGVGTLAYRDGWNLFDQIIISEPLQRKDFSSYRFYKAGIFDRNFLKTPNGRYKGYPFRSFASGRFTGGYSDHFPVYIYLIKEIEH